MQSHLAVGKFAPPFKAITFGGRIVDTTQLRGQKIWLSFYCHASCKRCTGYLSDLVKFEKLILERNIARIGVFNSPPGLITPALCGRGATPFPIIADPQKNLYDLYGATTKSGFFSGLFRSKQEKTHRDPKQMPAHFLIDEAGIVRTIHLGTSTEDQIPWAMVESFSKAASVFKAKSSVNLQTPDAPILDMTKPFALDKNALRRVSSKEKQKDKTIVEKIEQTATDLWRAFHND